MTDWTDVQYNFTMGNSSGSTTITVPDWGSGTYDASTVHYTPPAMLPPVPTAVAEDDLEWLRQRVTEIEEFSRIAA